VLLGGGVFGVFVWALGGGGGGHASGLA
jgi:hypothetical protein